MRIAFIENDDSFSWNVRELLPVDSHQLTMVRGGTSAALLAAKEADAVVIGPGPTDPHRAGLVDLVRIIAERAVPLLGICLGHQAIGLAFGASLRRTEPAHGRVSTGSLEPSRLFPGITGPLEVMRYHSLSLEAVAPPLRVVGRTADIVLAVEHQTLPIAGLQFHPDSFATPRGRELIEAFFEATGLARLVPSRPSTLPPTVETVSASDGASRQLPGVPLRLSEFDSRPGPFALLGPGFTGHWSVVDLTRPGPDQLLLARYEDRAPRVLSGNLVPVELAIDVAPRPVQVHHEESGFLQGVETIRELIAAGDVYQVNLTTRAQLTCESGAWLLARLCRRGVPRFAAWVRLPDEGIELVSASPELLFELEGRHLHAEPMKGTAGPGRSDWLLASEKNRAELAMITDLLRDDLHHVCEPGTVAVSAFPRAIALPYVTQTVSDVVGRLRPGLGVEAVFAQLHPGGSVTGAPRNAACAVIQQLERTPRGHYCGALGLVRSGTARVSLLIRTAERCGPTRWTYGTGSGITWASEARAELDEVRLKLDALR